jgi:putative DNA primase/helicase
VRIVELPGLPPKGDASDWIDAGGSIEDLQALVERAPAWEPEAADPLLALYSDETLTLAFTERHADELRYCDKFGAWFRWQGGCWREDVVRGVFSMARQLCRDKAGEVLARGERGADRIATQVGSARTVAAVVGLARADPRHATAPADWDADAWALNTPAGIVDLQSGKLRPHDRAALCSKITKVATARYGDGFSPRSPPATRSSSASSGA